MSTTQDGSDVIGIQDQILTPNLKRRPAVANKPLGLSGVYVPTSVDDCSMRYFCVRFGAADGGSVVVEGRPDDAVLTSCTEVVCQDNRPSCRVNGRTYKVGARWEGSDCTACVCQPNQQPSCTSLPCPPLACDVTVQDDGECCPRCANSCSLDEKVHEPSEVWENDRCETCTCNDGTVSCVGLSCIPPGCDESQHIIDEGECCPRCPRGCSNFTDIPRTSGESWQVDVCTNCQCFDGESHCTIVDCPFLPCDVSQAITEPGQCCARCPKACTYGFSLYDHGATWDENECTHCECNDGQPRCITDQCRPLECTNPTTIPGQCCSVCLTDECFHNGETYDNGQTWASDDNGAPQTCRCIQGTISCLLTTQEGDCLLENNEVRRHKESWDINCTRCLCRRGNVRCFSHPTRTGCGDCVVRGRHVQSGENYWRHEDGSCRRCVCGGLCTRNADPCPNGWQISGIQVFDVALTLDDDVLKIREGIDTKKFGFSLSVNIDTLDPYSSSYIAGTNMWKVKAWFSSKRDGTGPKNALRRQVLNNAKASVTYSGESVLQFRTRRIFKTNSYSCTELRYFCARFKASRKALLSYGEKLVINNNNEKDRLTRCVKVKGCK